MEETEADARAPVDADRLEEARWVAEADAGRARLRSYAIGGIFWGLAWLVYGTAQLGYGAGAGTFPLPFAVPFFLASLAVVWMAIRASEWL